MTANSDDETKSLYEERAATPEGAQGLAAARLARQVAAMLSSAKDRVGITNRELAERVGVSEGRVSQVLGSDGNLRIATIARFLRALGYEIELVARPTAPDLPSIGRRSRKHRWPIPTSATTGQWHPNTAAIDATIRKTDNALKETSRSFVGVTRVGNFSVFNNRQPDHFTLQDPTQVTAPDSSRRKRRRR